MNLFEKMLLGRTSERTESRYVVLVFACVVIFSQSMAGFHLFRISLSEPLMLVRFFHALTAFLTIIFILAFKKKWKFSYSVWTFVALVAPLYVTSWFSQVIYAESPKMFNPFLPFKLYPIVLAFLVPGPYWINFLFIVLFHVQATILWFYLDLPNLKNIVLGSEPIASVLFASISYMLLVFRYRDEKMIHKLGRDKANAEFFEDLTKIFLGLRDRANTPLQIQKVVTALLRRKYPQDEELFKAMEKSTNQLSEMNNVLGRFEPKLVSSFHRLMSEEEMIELLEKMETTSVDWPTK